MNTQEAARSNLERAGLVLEEAHRFRDKGAWNLVVRRCQEVVELALKGTLPHYVKGAQFVRKCKVLVLRSAN